PGALVPRTPRPRRSLPFPAVRIPHAFASVQTTRRRGSKFRSRDFAPSDRTRVWRCGGGRPLLELILIPLSICPSKFFPSLFHLAQQFASLCGILYELLQSIRCGSPNGLPLSQNGTYRRLLAPED